MARFHVARQLGLNPSRMDGRSAYAARAMPLIKCDGKENVCRLRAAIGYEWLIGGVLEVRVFQVHVRESKARGR
jgi:hypothetical protein